MPEPAGSAEVVFDIESAVLCGPAPLGQIEIPLRPGLTALYGLNGVGKSRTLEALENLFVDETPQSFFKLDVNRDVALAGLLASKLEIDDEVAAGISTYSPPWRERRPELALLGDWVACQWVGAFQGRPAKDEVISWLFGEHLLGAKRVQLIDEAVVSAEYVLCKRDGQWLITIAVRADAGPASVESNAATVEWWDGFLDRELAGTYEETQRHVPEVEIYEQLDDEWGGSRGPSPVPGVFHPLEAHALQHRLGPLGSVFKHGWDGDANEWEQDRLATLVRWIRILRDAGSTLYPIVDGTSGTIRCERSDFLPAWSGSGAPGGKSSKIRLEPDGGIIVRSEGRIDSFEQLDEVLTTRLWSGELTGDGERSYPMPITASDQGVELAEHERMACAEISELATATLWSFISTTFGLECVLFSRDRGAQPKLRWMARDESGAMVEPLSLSPIQRRWALLAANGGFMRMARGWSEADELQSIASDWDDEERQRPEKDFAVRWPVTSLTLVDEPEVGLHPSAARRAATALSEQALQEIGSVVVTTHSPQFLEANLGKAHEVYRTITGSVQVRPVPSLSDVRADALGMSKADLLLLYRVVLIVEGQHDEVILRSLIGDDLDRLGVLVLPLRGARGAKSLADAAILTRMLSTPIVILFDNDRSGQLEHFWAELQALHPGESARIDGLVKALPSEKDFPEVVYITSLARELHDRRQTDRFRILGLSLSDIVDYLPVDEFVKGTVSWAQLRTDHALLGELSEKEKKREGYQRDFKKWLAARYGADFSDTALRNACAELDDVPEDFIELAACLGEATNARSANRTERAG